MKTTGKLGASLHFTACSNPSRDARGGDWNAAPACPGRHEAHSHRLRRMCERPYKHPTFARRMSYIYLRTEQAGYAGCTAG